MKVGARFEGCGSGINARLRRALLPVFNGNWDQSDYYPFGGERAYVSADGNHYKFTRKERDTESGLDNFNARFDSSAVGRFMSIDPQAAGADSQSPQSWNAYSYAANNPANATDPDGNDCVFVQGDYAYVQRGDCTGIANGLYVAGTVDLKSGRYDHTTHMLHVEYAPYSGEGIARGALFSGTQECHRTNRALRLGRSAAAAALCSVDYPVCLGPGTT